jgi:hypothetical protein
MNRQQNTVEHAYGTKGQLVWTCSCGWVFEEPCGTQHAESVAVRVGHRCESASAK